VAKSTDWLNGVVSKLDLNKPFPLVGIRVPPVRRDGPFLYFRPSGPFRDAPRSDRLLYDFAGLTDATMITFAECWGPLGLCHQHWLPVLHKQEEVCVPHVYGEEFAESVVGWWYLIAKVASILSIRTALADGRTGNPEDWEIVFPRDVEPPTNVFDASAYLAITVTGLLGAANVRPFVDPYLGIYFASSATGSIFDMRWLKANRLSRQYPEWFGNAGMLPATIIMQLALAVTAGRGLMRCNACRSLYQPTKAPREGERHFCPKCGKTAADRIIKRIKRGDTEAEALAKERR
jgi:hypothetical protein